MILLSCHHHQLLPLSPACAHSIGNCDAFTTEARHCCVIPLCAVIGPNAIRPPYTSTQRQHFDRRATAESTLHLLQFTLEALKQGARLKKLNYCQESNYHSFKHNQAHNHAHSLRTHLHILTTTHLQRSDTVTAATTA